MFTLAVFDNLIELEANTGEKKDWLLLFNQDHVVQCFFGLSFLGYNCSSFLSKLEHRSGS